MTTGREQGEWEFQQTVRRASLRESEKEAGKAFRNRESRDSFSSLSSYNERESENRE